MQALVCQICKQLLICKCQTQEQRQDQEMTDLELKIDQLAVFPKDMVDIQINQKTRDLQVITKQGKIIKMNKVEIRIPSHDVQRNDLPIYRYDDMNEQKDVKKYWPSYETINQNYSHARGKQLLNKIIHDNNLSFAEPELTKVYYDIETYNISDWSSVPLLSDSNSFIGLIGVYLVYTDLSKHKLMFVNDHEFDLSNVDKDIEYMLFKSERLMCQAFIQFIQSLGICILIGFNSSADIYGNSQTTGYDLPFIIARSRINLTTQIKQFQLNSQDKSKTVKSVNHKSSQQIIAIDQLPLVQICDFNKLLEQGASQDDKNNILGKSLDSWLELYQLQKKLDHDYQDLQMRLSQWRSSIGDIINYCIYDCIALNKLDNHKGIIDQKLSVQKITKLPISWCLHWTSTNLTTHVLQQKFINAGYLVCYSKQDDGQQKRYKGAYTENKAEPNKVYHNVIDLDFQSLYPTCIIAKNICLTTYLIDVTTFPINELGDIPSSSINVSDDDSTKDDIYWYSREPGIIPQYLRELKEQRLIHKRLYKETKLKLHDHMQLQIKLMMNGMYGLMGCRFNLLYFQPIAVSITAMARQATICARDIIISRGHLFLNSDTDSVFFQLSSEQICSGEQVDKECHEINQLVQQKLGSPEFVLEHEEIITSIMFIDGRKSYVALQMTYSMKEWQFNELGYDEIKFRGVSWSQMNGFQRDKFKQDIIEFMTSSAGILPDDFYKRKQLQMIKEIKDAIITCNRDVINKYTQRINSSSKLYSAQMEQFHLKDKYVQCVFLKGNLNKSQRIVPLHCLSNGQLQNIDVDSLVNNQMSMLAKFLLKSDQKKTSKFKDKVKSQMQQLNDLCILVRQEKLTTTKTTYKSLVLNIEQVDSFMKKFPEYAIHEIIYRNKIRLSFDVDYCEDLMKLKECICKVMSQFCSHVPNLISIKSTGQKQSYHIFSNISVKLDFAQLIAEQVNQMIGYKSIDSSIYYLNKSLRLPNSIKIVNHQIDQRTYQLNDIRLLPQCMITNLDSCFYVTMPLSLSNKPSIDQCLVSQIPEKYTDEHRDHLQRFLNGIGLYEQSMIQTNNRIDIRMIPNYLCPIHKQIHQRENLFGICGKTQVKLMCYRSEESKRKTENIVIKLKKMESQQEQQTKQSLLDLALLSQNEDLVQLEDSVIQNNQYFQLSQNLKSKNTFISSSLGSGKTQWLTELLKDQHFDRVLILSHRRTFTSNVQKRYGSQSYTSFSGQMHLDNIPLLIAQVEVLDKIYGCPNLLIIDECESIFSQFNNYIATKKNAIRRFIQLLNQSERVIICDGFLQQTTIDVIQHLSNHPSKSIHQNVYQPYKDKVIQIGQFTSSQKILSRLLSCVYEFHQSNKKLVMFLTSKALAKSVHSFSKLLGVKSKLYTGDDTSMDESGQLNYITKINDLQDVENQWSKIDLLLYTSCITSGVDFSLDHFDGFVHVFSKSTCDSLSFVQGCLRIRKFRDQTNEIWIEEQYGIQAKSCREMIRQEDQQIYYNDVPDQMNLFCQSRQTYLNVYRESIICRCLNQLGYTIQKTKVELTERTTLDKQEFEFVELTQQHLDFFDKLQYNKDNILKYPIPPNYTNAERLISIFLSVGIKKNKLLDPCFKDQELVQQIISLQSQLMINKRIQKIGQTLDEAMNSINKDKQMRMIQLRDKGINYMSIKEDLQLIEKANKAKDKLMPWFDGESFRLTSEELKQLNVIDYSPKWKQNLKKLMAVIGYDVKTKNGKGHDLNRNPIKEVIIERLMNPDSL